MRLRSVPEDFCVDELPLYLPTGQGEHTFLHVEKRLRTTEDIVRVLARHAGVKASDIGYAGRKDRDAVTTQWLSVPGLEPDRARALTGPGLRVIDAIRHGHKLRTGQLAGNRFRIVVRDVGSEACEVAIRRMEELVRSGMPNRFGEQRFGRSGDNAVRAQGLLRGEERIRDRREARFLISALQAAVFNAVLAEREQPFDEVAVGDVATVHESGGSFVVEDVAREAARAAEFEISATGPIFGTKMLEPVGAAAALERDVLARFGVLPENLRVPRGIKLRGARRALRIRPGAASAARDGAGLLLRFTLPPGSYATVLVDELFGRGSSRAGSDDIGRVEGVS